MKVVTQRYAKNASIMHQNTLRRYSNPRSKIFLMKVAALKRLYLRGTGTQQGKSHEGFKDHGLMTSRKDGSFKKMNIFLNGGKRVSTIRMSKFPFFLICRINTNTHKKVNTQTQQLQLQCVSWLQIGRDGGLYGAVALECMWHWVMGKPLEVALGQ